MVTKYNKLVRDRIPQIIEDNGQKPVTRTLSVNEYKEQLKAKLLEEAHEFIESDNVVELADVMEVVYAILDSMDCSRERLEAIRLDKAKRNGAFRERILLEQVIK